jgi:hypothetical protein
MFITEDAMQVNLTPENEHEKRFVDILRSTGGDVSIHKGVDIGTCQGGYMRNFGERDKSTCITILNPQPKSAVE